MSDTKEARRRGPHAAYLVTFARIGGSENDVDLSAMCGDCEWSGAMWRTKGPALRELLEHERDTAQAAYGSLRKRMNEITGERLP